MEIVLFRPVMRPCSLRIENKDAALRVDDFLFEASLYLVEIVHFRPVLQVCSPTTTTLKIPIRWPAFNPDTYLSFGDHSFTLAPNITSI